ncbi:thiolase family protein [Psychromarinibacter sp. C21-152]|uniref:Thiolase family protein n=1 Tax=Psychromarinibacter sediminicola TaxID=3033385 RepID=A0AAE3T869_9RHOB|nr:thiolase family protein [Psychromarinibacter sediminicola]MDF0600952.1 thiolase family protein [Psychromarinibacter sediminicola]
MTGAVVAGVGMVKFDRYREKTLADIAWPAVKQALLDSGVERADIQATFCGTALGGMLAGQRILKALGMTGGPIINTEDACSSSAAAFNLACQTVTSGAHDLVLVIGAEKLTRFDGGLLPLEREDGDVQQGLSMPAYYALRARRYMHETGTTPEDLAAVSVKARAHGAKNPDAQYQTPVTVQEVLASRRIADPLTLLQCCPSGDGAAAAIVCSETRARQLGLKPVWVRAALLNSGLGSAGASHDMARAVRVQESARTAYDQAGLGPEDIDVVELHDAFTVGELIYYEALGLCGFGDGPKLLHDGETSIGGRVPVNAGGGLLVRGHPIGATGVAQIVELTRQLRGTAGARQVDGARIALAHTMGGGISGMDYGACSIQILEAL